MSEATDILSWETATIGRRILKVEGYSHVGLEGVIVAIEASINKGRKSLWVRFDSCSKDCSASSQSTKLNACDGFAEPPLFKVLSVEQCICDFNSVLMIFGCQCGGK